MKSDHIQVTEAEFYKDISGWLNRAKECQIIVVDSEGNTKIVVGVGPIEFADDTDIDRYLSNLPTREDNIDIIHNPWLD